MSAEKTKDKIKGRAKESWGAVTDDDQLRREGKADQTSGKIKEKISDAADAMERGADKLKERIKDHT